MTKVIRLTLFKISDPAVVKEACQIYATLTQDALKDGKPYIQLASASPTHDDPRAQGVTMVARTVFNSMDDFNYYDTECEAHNKIKAFIKPNLTGPPLMVLMDTEAHN